MNSQQSTTPRSTFNTKIFVGVLLVIAVLLGLNYYYKPFYHQFLIKLEQQKNATSPTPTPTISAKQQLFEQLTAKQKIWQVMAVPLVLGQDVAEASQSAQLQWIIKNEPGLVTVFGQEITQDKAQQQLTQLQQSYEQALPPLIAVDHEGGRVQRLRGQGFTQLPSWRQLCSNLDQAEQQQDLQNSAQELAAVGINIVFAPVVDLATNNSVLGDRTCSDDLSTTQQAAENFILTFAEQGIMPVLKHFPGIGQAQQDLHQQAVAVQLRPEDARIFQYLLDQYPNIGVMTSHLRLQNKLSGRPCSLSSECLSQFSQIYNETLVFTDALDMASALQSVQTNSETATAVVDDQQAALIEAAKQAIMAGNDVLVFGKGVTTEELDQVAAALVAEYEINPVFERNIDESVIKIMRLKNLQE
ncbi:MAG: hypothetical protein GF390_00680 [Candidatus Pacebacteria bacterium]|nr:hypothetical protein [Candidatus Paceibacterota bacterium]